MAALRVALGCGDEFARGPRTEGVALWVQAVVVLWTELDQRSIERDKVAWVRGGDLTEVLAARPVKHSGEAVEQLSAATRSAVTRL